MKLSNFFYALGFVSIGLSASQYVASDKANKERDGLFLGHWAPTFFILGKVVEDREERKANVLTGEKES